MLDGGMNKVSLSAGSARVLRGLTSGLVCSCHK